MFLLKKIVGSMVMPISTCLLFLISGISLLFFTRRNKAGKILVSVGTIFLVTFSFGSIVEIFLSSLEYRYPPLMNFDLVSDVKWVAVLGGGHTSDQRLPVTGQISRASLGRLIEGIRIYNKLPGCKLLLSGGAVFDPTPEANVMAEVAHLLGANQGDLLLESASKDTRDQAIKIKEIIGSRRFIVVTSAYHMPRTMAIFQKIGLQPIPAPIDYWVKKNQEVNPISFFPKADNLLKMEQVCHEYLGMAWAKLRGQI